MTVVKTYTMKCDQCGTQHDEEHHSITDLNIYRRSEGWTVASTRDVCPECNGNDVKYWTFPRKGDE
jgi:rRNA maturation protein Nop10